MSKLLILENVMVPSFVGLLGRGRCFLPKTIGSSFLSHSRKQIATFF
jgi:hypothetical protein